MTLFRLVSPVAAIAALALTLATPTLAAEEAAPAATEEAAPAAAPAEEAAPAAEAPAEAAAEPAAEAPAEAAAPEGEAPAAAEAAPAEAAPEAAEAAPAEAAPAAASEISSKDLVIGTPVMASDGVQIGEINRVTSDAAGKVSEIHVTAGMPAGLNAKVRSIPAKLITATGSPVKVSISGADANKLPILDDGNG